MKIACIILFIVGATILLGSISRIITDNTPVKTSSNEEIKYMRLDRTLTLLNSFFGCMLMCIATLTFLI